MTVYERVKDAWKPIRRKVYELFVKNYDQNHDYETMGHNPSKAAQILYSEKIIDVGTLNSICRLHFQYEKYMHIQNEKLNEEPEEEIDQFIQECDLTLKQLVKAEEKAEKLAKK